MPIRQNDAPLIVSAILDTASFACLDRLRRRHFPPALNKLPAHLTLFHQLPGEAEAEILLEIDAAMDGRASIILRASCPKFLGRGVAIFYEGHELESLRAALATRWSGWLTAQDRQPFRPHVTIQNKVAPEQGRALAAEMMEARLPDVRIEGLAVSRYLGGPWEAIAERRFAR